MSKPAKSTAEPKVHQIGADSWSRDRADLKPGEARRYPPEVRERTAVLAVECDGRAADVRRALEGEFDHVPPIETIRRWTRETMADLPAPSVSDAAQRALRLISSELRRLEGAPASKLDLTRLSQAAQILKTLDSIGPSKRAPSGPRTLEDLSTGRDLRS